MGFPDVVTGAYAKCATFRMPGNIRARTASCEASTCSTTELRRGSEPSGRDRTSDRVISEVTVLFTTGEEERMIREQAMLNLPFRFPGLAGALPTELRARSEIGAPGGTRTRDLPGVDRSIRHLHHAHAYGVGGERASAGFAGFEPAPRDIAAARPFQTK